MTAWLLLLWLQAQTAMPPATSAGPPTGPSTSPQTNAAEAVDQYLADLETSTLLAAEEPSVQRLKQLLISAEDALVTGNPQVAATRLFRVVESPAWRVLSFSPEYQNAEFAMGRVLLRLGAYGSARRYLLRVLARGPGQPYYAAATRVMVDIALETRDAAGVLAQLTGVSQAADLPADSRDEQAYLRGKIAYEGGELAQSEAAFGAIDRQSRFYASALYFRALIQARLGRLGAARRNLCEIVEPADKGRFRFFIDGRYYAIKDLAYLALGRLAHEQRRYDDAYYFYFRVPEDSELLPEALFEAAWSMFQKGEYEAAGAFVDQFERMFPRSPLAPDVALLHAMIALKSCAFDQVRTTLDAFVKTYAPLQVEIAALLKDPERRRELYRRLLSRDRIGGAPDRVVELLKIDGAFYRTYGYIVALDREASLLPGDVALWGELAAKREGTGAGSEAVEAEQLARDAAALLPATREDPELAQRVGALVEQARQAAAPPAARGPLAAEAAATQALGGAVQRLRARLVTAAAAVAEGALIDLDRRLRKLLAQARLTHIDAVIGKKKKLEIEIANLRDGRYPAEMFARLQLEGLMGDDEEYWPFEGEYWSDEYENYK